VEFGGINMKVRRGFVSNSSTTSFCIYGAFVDTDEELMYDKCYEADLECYSYPYDRGYWVGLDWACIRDDETGAQFKARVEGKLFELFKVRPEDCSTHEEAWRDG
jgi:hypothetical protein